MTTQTDLSKPEPAPQHNDNPSCHDLVMKDMQDRKAFGLNKYGTILQPENGRNFLVDAYQEVLDLAVYLRGAIYEQENRQPTIEAVAIKLECGVVMSLPRPARHHDIIREVGQTFEGKGKPIVGTQGFVLSDGAFVNRKQAVAVALRSGQLESTESSELFSEDLW